MAQRLPFHRSLLGRSLLLGVLPAAVVVLAVVAVNGVRAWNSVSRSLENDLHAATGLVTRELDARIERNLALVRLLAASQESGQFGRRADSLRMIERIVRDTPEVYGATLGYAPDADGNDAAGPGAGVPAEALGPGGRFWAYAKRDAAAPGGVRIERLETGHGTADADMWYWLPRERFERSGLRDAIVTRPSTYLGVDMLEHVAPIVVDGRFAGVAGIDVALTEVQRALDSVAERLGAEVFVVSRGLFVGAAGGDARYARFGAKQVSDDPLAPLIEDAASRGGAAWEWTDPASGEAYFVVAAEVPTGGWKVVVRKPTRVVRAGVTAILAANLVTAVVGMVVLATLLTLGALAISRRVRASHGLAERIAAGDLSSEPVVVGGGDETAALAAAMNRMNSDLAAMVAAVRGASARLAATSAQLGSTSREQRATVGAFGESTAQIAAAVREIAATGDELLRSIEVVDAGARRTRESAASGRVRLEAVSTTMERLDAGTRAIADRLGIIAEKAAAISSVVVAISKVAEQTNLLSVNAAIEAEKAGDAGYGFLVVAREIRRLADQTAGASLDIARIVGQMQSSVSEGVAEMARFSTDMRQGTGEVQATAGDIGEAISAIEESFQRFSEVRAGMSGATAGVSQIEVATARVAEGASQSATATEELGRVADELAYAVAVLQDAAARFRLRGEAQS